MNLRASWLSLLLLLNASYGFSQNKIDQIFITISFENEKLGDVFQKLGKEYGISFALNSDVEKLKISGRYVNQSLSDVLNKIADQTGLEYKIIGQQIVFKKKIEHQPVSQKHTINGYIRDSKTGENLIGATIFDRKANAGTVSNSFGHYSLTLHEDSVAIVSSFVGYQPAILHLDLQKDTIVNILLEEASLLGEVVIRATRAEDIQQTTMMGRFVIPVEQVKSLPTLFGERDLIKVLQLLPGVSGGSEGSSGLYVRGGGPDQNLVLLDGIPIYNASHLYGFFSTFNSDAINHVELIKGGFPARYGGRLSSVVDIAMKEGNQEKLKGRASVGIVSSKILLEGPIDKNSTFLFSARRSYLNLLKFAFFAPQQELVTDKYYLFDLNGRLNYRLGKNDRIFLSGYAGGDKAQSNGDADVDSDKETYHGTSEQSISWGNRLAALRWNHVYSPKLFSNVSATYSKYQFSTAIHSDETYTKKPDGEPQRSIHQYEFSSLVEDVAAKIEFDYTPSTKHYIRFGAGITHHNFNPGILAVFSKQETEKGTYTSNSIRSNEPFAYIEDDMDITSKLKMNVGVHATAFVTGNKTYHSVQPRISARYLVNEQVSLKASYASMAQFAHLLTNAGIGLPTDLWVPSTNSIKPQQSQQWALGTAAKLENDFEVSIEAYYKDMKNVIEYKDGATYLSSNQDWQQKVEVGRGNSYGTEFFLQKKVGRFTGWVGYTLSWTNRQFDHLNHGKWFPYRYDRRHDLKFTGTWHVSKNFELGAVWVYATGNAVTLPLTSYAGATYSFNFDGPPIYDLVNSQVVYADSRNNYRMRSYHRMDISATYIIKRPKLSHEFNVSVYNVYARKNPYYLYSSSQINQDGTTRETVIRQASLIGLIPSVSYSIAF